MSFRFFAMLMLLSSSSLPPESSSSSLAQGKVHMKDGLFVETCRMRDILGRYNLHASNINKLMDQSSLHYQYENCNLSRLSKEVEDKTKQLRKLRGEDLDGLNLEELQRLEKLLESGLSRVSEKKGESVMSQISSLERRGSELVDENRRLREKLVTLERAKTMALKEAVETESATTNVSSYDSGAPCEDDFSDTSLKLGLPSWE